MKTLRTFSLTTIASLLVACDLYAQAQTKAPSGGVIRREGEPEHMPITEDHKAMNRAVETAQKTVNGFGRTGFGHGGFGGGGRRH